MQFLNDLTGRQRLLVLVLLITVVSVLLALFWHGLVQAILVSFIIIFVLFISKGIWLPDNFGNTLVRRISLGVVSLVVLSSTFWNDIVGSLIIVPIFEYLGRNLPWLRGLSAPESSPTIEVLIFSFLVIYVVNYFASDRTAMRRHSEPLEKEFPEKKYKDRLNSFCNILRKDIQDINRETNWSDEFFTPLDAEVEVRKQNTTRRKITDLLSAIKLDRTSKVLLVLGDPGAGKSVALRKLCTDLLTEVKKTGKVPIYINLREWDIKQPWSKENPPTVTALYDFVFENLKNRGDLFTGEFLEVYFRKMYEHGRLFFVLDSFDEIPAVLDVDESSWLIDALSNVIYKFLGGAHDSRGVLASRVFRKPTQKFQASTVLEIRPFSEEKIIKRFKKSVAYDAKLERLVFYQNPKLIQVARNPFLASLIMNYAKNNNYALPKNQVDLYDNYISERLHMSSRVRYNNAFGYDQTLEAMTEIAFFMFTKPSFGLEAPKSALITALPNYPIEAIIDNLVYCRLGRVGGGEEKLFSFVHRRFNEFLIAKKLIKMKELVPTDSIPTDSRWRDSLVLYCEISSVEDATSLAQFCWSQIKIVKDEKLSIVDPEYRRAIHCLRFLNDAFRYRPECIIDFQGELSEFVINQISPHHLLESKLSVEAVGLMVHEKTDYAVCLALNLRNSWISETALRSCRHLPKISSRLYERLIRHLLLLHPLETIKRRSEIQFSLGLSEGFKKVQQFFTALVLDTYLSAVGVFLLALLSPSIALVGIGNYVAATWIVEFMTATRDSRPAIKVQELVGKVFDASALGYLFLTSYVQRLLFPVRLTVAALIVVTVLFKERSELSIFPSYFLFDSEVVHTGLLICALLAIFPWLDLYAVNLLLRRHRFTGFWQLLLLGFAIVIVSTLFFWILIRYVPEELRHILMISLAVVSGFTVTTFMVAQLITAIRDHQKFKSMSFSDNLSRELIESHLLSFKTSYGRLIFVKKLASLSLKVSGNWKNSKIPNFSDEASTILARLEERWLGFDR